MTACAQSARLRIEAEYIEMPSLKLKLAQIRRLCDLPDELCGEAVRSLIANGFLYRTADGSYIRRIFAAH